MGNADDVARYPVGLPTDGTIRMAGEEVSVVVLDDDQPIGIVTDRDLVLRHLALGHSGDCRVKEALTPDRLSLRLVTVSPQQDIISTAERIGEEGVRRLLVMEDGRLVGILSASDLIAEFRDAVDGLLADGLVRWSFRRWPMADTRANRWASVVSLRPFQAVVAGVVVLLLAGVTVTIIVARQPAATFPPDSPQATVASYLRLLQSGQVDEAYVLTAFEPAPVPSPYGAPYPVGAPMTRAAFHQAFDAWSQTPHQVVLLRSTVSGANASVTVEIATFSPDLFGGGDRRSQQTFTLVRQNGAWRISGPSYLYP